VSEHHTAVVTGAASGIGFELAHRFGRAGMNLVLGDVEGEPLADAERSLSAAGYPVIAERIDVSELDDIRRLEAAATDRFGKVHVLCNNAGVGGGGAVADPDALDLWRWTIEVNLWGVIYGCKVFLPAMLEHGEPCHVVNTASMAGHQAPPLMGAYNVSKYGVVALSETLVREMQMLDSNVGVSVLCPAFVKTGIAQSGRNMPDHLETEEAVRVSNPDMLAMLEALVDGGIGPDVVAAATLEAIEQNRFWILTHEGSTAGIVARAEEIAKGTNPTLDIGPI